MEKYLQKYARLMNEEDGGDVDAGGTAPAPESTPPAGESATNHSAELANMQETLNKALQGYHGLDQTLKGLQPKLDAVDKLSSLFSPQEEKNRFENVSMSNVTEAAEHALQTGALTREEVNALKSEIAEIKSQREADNYQMATLEFNEKWIDKFGDQQSMENALNLVAQKYPKLEQQFTELANQGKVPGVDFVRQLDAAVSTIVADEMFNPESAIAKAITQRIAQLEARRNSSVMEGEGSSGAKTKEDDSFITVSYD